MAYQPNELSLARRKCPTCHIDVSEGSEFVKHMGTHEERMKYRCIRCDIPFDTQNELSDHEKTHENRNRDGSNAGSNYVDIVAIGGVQGAASGAIAGAVLGPVGAVVGASIGASVGATVRGLGSLFK